MRARHIAGQHADEPLGRRAQPAHGARFAAPCTDHHIGVLQRRDQLGDGLSRIGAIGVGHDDELALGAPDAGAARRPGAHVVVVPHEDDILAAFAEDGGVVGGAIVDHDDLIGPPTAA